MEEVFDNKKYNYFYGNEDEKYQFFQIPKSLVSSDEFSDLSLECKLLYGILLNRMNLSRVNKDKFTDEQGRLFIIYGLDELAALLNFKKSYVSKLMSNLVKFGLIEKKRVGNRRKDVIYVKNFATHQEKSINIAGSSLPHSPFRDFIGDEAKSYHFLRIPQLLVTSSHFDKLSLKAKVVYGILLDRLDLSYKNSELFTDENGIFFVIYSVRDLAFDLNISKSNASRILAELDEFGLIEKKLNKGSNTVLYIKNFSTPVKDSRSFQQNSQQNAKEVSQIGNSEDKGVPNRKLKCPTLETQVSQIGNSGVPNRKLIIYNNTNISNTDSKNTNSSNTNGLNKRSDMSINTKKTKSKNLSNVDDLQSSKARESVYSKLEKQLDIDGYIQYVETINSSDKNKILGYLHLVVDTICDVMYSPAQKYSISGKSVSGSVLKKKFETLRYEDIEAAVSYLQEHGDGVKNKKAYIISFLANRLNAAFQH